MSNYEVTKCHMCGIEIGNLNAWRAEEDGEDIFICEGCMNDHITENEPEKGLYCSLCSEYIIDPKESWLWNRKNDICVCDKCLSKGDFHW